MGKVVATHGIRGQLRIAVYSGQFETILSLDSLMLKGPDGKMESFEVAKSVVHGRKLLIALREYDIINQVQHLVGRDVYADRDQLPELDEGEYYWCDLLGLKVVTEQGEFLGTVTDIIATGSNDVYVVTNDARECLIPALEDVVLDIDLDKEKMVVRPPDGLLDL